MLAYEEDVLDALGDGTRRAVLLRLRDGGRSVGEIAAGMEVSRPAVSQHLKVLREARLVRMRAAGTRRIYEIDPQGVLAARRWLSELWDTALPAYKAEAEREAKLERNR